MYNFDGSRVCVTGGAGFFGSHLVEELARLGAEVYVLDDLSRGENFVDGVYYIKGDAGDVSTCLWAFRGGLDGGVGKPMDVVFNLAAVVAGVAHNMAYGHEMLVRNVPLQVNPIAAAEQLGVPIFVQVSSACIYDPKYNHPAKESMGEIGEPHSANYGYGWSKRLGEKMLLQSHIENRIVVRPSNLYGPRDYFGEKAHVIPSLIRQYVDGSARLIGDGRAVREFFYVRDAAKALIHLASFCSSIPGNYHVYNIGTNGDTKISISQLHERIARLVGTKIPRLVGTEMEFAPDHKNPELERWSDCTLLQLSGFKWETNLDDGLKETVEWYLEQQ